jgi:O-succinylbenzoic acid--CoA ligase
MSIGPIDWHAHTSVLFLNPRLSQEQHRHLHHEFSQKVGDQAVIGVATSGTTQAGTSKIVLLSREALSCAAKGAVEFLQLDQRDIWLHVLPDFHVGGLAIWARSQVCGMRVVRHEMAWHSAEFFRTLESTAATWCSLVPTQVFDLVKSQSRAPSSLRGVLVGGGALPESLYRAARELGWPVLPSYGLTECCSQVATAPLSSLLQRDFPRLRVLPHVQVRSNTDEVLEIFSPALLSGYLVVSGSATRFEDPRHAGWLITDDCGEVSEGHWLKLHGRRDDQVKVLGELVSLARLQWLLDQELAAAAYGGAVVTAVSDERSGHRVVCATESRGLPLAQLRESIRRVNHQVLPFERIGELRVVSKIPRTDLGKVQRTQLQQLLHQVPSEPI